MTLGTRETRWEVTMSSSLVEELVSLVKGRTLRYHYDDRVVENERSDYQLLRIINAQQGDQEEEGDRAI